MKILSLFAAFIVSLFSINIAYAQTISQGPAVKTDTIKVWGNCGMCKSTIEKSAKNAGAKTASWDEESKQLKVSFAANKTSSAKIQQSIAKAGYDTQDFTAVQSAYDNLHGCCKYDRKASVSTNAKGCCVPGEKCSMDAADCKKMDCCKYKTCCKS